MDPNTDSTDPDGSEHDDTPTLGARITAARKHAGLTQQQLADSVGISARALGSIENDRAVPSTKNLTAIEYALNVRFDDDTSGPPPSDDPGPGMTLPDLIARRMTLVGIPSTRGLARASEINPQSISMIRQGRSVPEADNLRKIARALTGPDELLADVYDEFHRAAYRRVRAPWVPPVTAHDMTDRERALVVELINTLVANRRTGHTEQARAARASHPGAGQ